MTYRFHDAGHVLKSVLGYNDWASIVRRAFDVPAWQSSTLGRQLVPGKKPIGEGAEAKHVVFLAHPGNGTAALDRHLLR